jgi:type III restriction enzyme
VGDAAFYAQELFEQEELTGYLKNMLKDTEKSVYQHVVYDSDVEKDFADQLEKNTAIKVYAKLPGWFKVPTPLGTYNPDWAVQIACGRAHFQALAVGENPARFGKFKDVAGLLSEVAELDSAVKECLK